MKKFLVLLLILSLSLLVFTGCNSVVPAEGEGEGEGEIEGISVDIVGAVDVDGKTYLARGVHDITVTFPASVAGWVQG